MRQGLRFWASGLLVMAVFAPSALGASPGDIYTDLADGKLDGSYTRVELEAYARDAAVQGYGAPSVIAPVGGIAGESGSGQAGQGQGEQSGGIAPTQTPLAQTGSQGTLPFTGSELGLFALVGGALIVGGLILRTSARPTKRKTSS